MTPPRMLAAEPPLDPTSPEARDLIIGELSKPEYTAARPTWFDLLAKQFWDWLNSLDFAGLRGPDAFGVLVFVVLIAVGILVAFLVFGLPRLNRRSAGTSVIFGTDDDRSAEVLRQAAASAAARREFDVAVEEMFRALVRDLADRTLVAVTPGTTSRGFAVRAGAVFAAHADALIAVSRAFDEARYLGRGASKESWERIRDLDSELRTARPELAAVEV